MIEVDTSWEEVETLLQLIEHNKVYVHLEDIDKEAYQQSYDMIFALKEENDRLRKAITDARDVATMELNPSNYDHEDACELNNQMIEADGILRAALKGT